MKREMKHLLRALDSKGIEYRSEIDRYSNVLTRKHSEDIHLRIPYKDGELSVICNPHSKGYDDGWLEVLKNDEKESTGWVSASEVMGWLNAREL